MNVAGYRREWDEAFGKKHGLEKGWYEDGQLMYMCMYRNDKKNGIHISWWGNGELHSVQTFADNLSVGPASFWWDNGRKRSKRHDSGITFNWEMDGQLIHQ